VQARLEAAALIQANLPPAVADADNAACDDNTSHYIGRCPARDEHIVFVCRCLKY
jgi:hypothetical protein